MAWDPPPLPLPPPTGRPAVEVPEFDDAAFHAALTRFSAPLGFSTGEAASSTDVAHRHDVVHPDGISMRCTVIEDGGKAANAQGIAILGLFVVGLAIDVLAGNAGLAHGAAEAGSTGASSRVYAEFNRRSARGSAIEGLGERAVWNADGESMSSISVLRHGRLLTVQIRSAADPVAQYGWLHACAAAVLPCV